MIPIRQMERALEGLTGLARVAGVAAALVALSPAASGQDLIQAAVLQHAGSTEVSVSFAANVNIASRTDPANFTIPGVDIQQFRFIPADNSALLTTAPLAANTVYTLNAINLVDTGGNALPAASAPFSTRDFSWAVIGANELGFENQVVAVSTNGFNLVSGASQMFGTYDESTFAYRQVEGDFDMAVRVESQEPASPYARAGLMVREALDEGRPRPIDPLDLQQAFSRYLQVSVVPSTSAEGQPGSNTHEVLARPYTGGIGSPNFDATEFVPVNNNAPPSYPNAWVRLVRSGQTFSAFRSNDGVNWVPLANFAFPQNFPNTVLVGPNYSPDVGNISQASDLRRAFVTRFREFSLTARIPDPEAPTISIALVGTQVEVTWDKGVLQSSPFPHRGDLWVDVPNVASPFRIAPGEPVRFYRARN